jgi:hypothetical protein
MYSTCLFCAQPLGRNEVLEQFPVGRRIAFDAEKGRLWVVCLRCARWNLTPLKERWEAIEQAERLFRGTRLRMSTDHIGLARLPEGLELVRVGRPARPEIAAWRYGNQFARRRRNRLLGAGALATGGGLLVVGSLAAGLGILGWHLGNAGAQAISNGVPRRTIARMRGADGTLIRVQRRHLHQSSLAVSRDGSFALELEHTGGSLFLQGADAKRMASKIFPAVSGFGGTRDEVRLAVERLDRAGDSERFLIDAARRGATLTGGGHANGRRTASDDAESGLLALSTSFSLALEMALHEEQERRALEGELEELEREWRQAEEIGAIADSMFLPPWMDEAIRRLRGSSELESESESESDSDSHLR